MRLKAKSIIDNARSEGRKFVTEPEAKVILREYGVPITNEMLAHTVDEAVNAAKSIGYPVAMKLVSPQVVHKTEFNAVKLNVSSDRDVRVIFDDLVARAKATGFDVTGVLISEMSSGTEIIIGSLRDPQFGQMIMLGLGGIFVEVYKDVSYRLAPVEAVDVKEMLSELKGRKLLEGFRGREKADTDALIRTVIAVSEVLADFREISEMDLNPIFVNGKSIKVADARIMVD